MVLTKSSPADLSTGQRGQLESSSAQANPRAQAWAWFKIMGSMLYFVICVLNSITEMSRHAYHTEGVLGKNYPMPRPGGMGLWPELGLNRHSGEVTGHD